MTAHIFFLFIFPLLFKAIYNYIKHTCSLLCLLLVVNFFFSRSSSLDLMQMFTERILLCVDKFNCSTNTKQLYAFCFCVNICLDWSCEDWRITIYAKMMIKIAWFGTWIDSISFNLISSARENAEFMFSSCTNKLLSINFNIIETTCCMERQRLIWKIFFAF